eukprot:CAMPEP_0114992212 /NCGR_PEP_ID=MMETSP0216-20121206/11813_1 /TAXON_ID=223996 /ORGANISM="Protocruzia adherens, Strain Boccale" /LENGTH=421 /DNA_ID=CAMNT_0002355647 /DNA_START=147 /DNA_END=1412 /DNA_ORIENTATION=+
MTTLVDGYIALKNGDYLAASAVFNAENDATKKQLALGHLYRAQGSFDEAVDKFRAAVSDTRAFFPLGEALLQLSLIEDDDNEELEATIKRILEANIGSDIASHSFGTTITDAEAANVTKEIIEHIHSQPQSETFTDYKDFIRVIVKAAWNESSSKEDFIVEIANELANLETYIASECFEEAITNFPMRGEAYMLNGFALAWMASKPGENKQKLYQEAFEDVADAIDLGFQDVSIFTRGNLYEKIREAEFSDSDSDRLKRALNFVYQQASLVVSAGRQTVMLKKASTLESNKEFSLALKKYEQVLGVNSTSQEAKVGKARALYHLSDFERALSTITNDKSLNARLLRGSCLMGKEEYDDGVEVFESILKDFSNQREALWNSVVCYHKKGDKPRQISSAKKYLDAYPNSVVGYRFYKGHAQTQ